ncbi:MAG: hypothetical protein HY314_03360 [Acidobacteria bacterium]|nr:hypothetical protein [Acidobacteriota bacterium]
MKSWRYGDPTFLMGDQALHQTLLQIGVIGGSNDLSNNTGFVSIRIPGYKGHAHRSRTQSFSNLVREQGHTLTQEELTV